ncbi:hypothetical protein Daes_0849 [Pseudodesulfovibrio aespoeensis Aspo-2]|uniref:Uncharacterized protein n=1 Tax=Pseudodesulfovibrio aespoeensis (strain ATCC 700646 / DSM 10631 / Aspo-2) TaxID=643562 RepID=E6VRD7_PSEA9|nr:hypothetical protein Daes_0849 [Pseudodesulfovibrio aespoeensis Aspo-2]
MGLNEIQALIVLSKNGDIRGKTVVVSAIADKLEVESAFIFDNPSPATIERIPHRMNLDKKLLSQRNCRTCPIAIVYRATTPGNAVVLCIGYPNVIPKRTIRFRLVHLNNDVIVIDRDVRICTGIMLNTVIDTPADNITLLNHFSNVKP